METLFCLLLSLGGGNTPLLNHDDYATRENAQERLKLTWWCELDSLRLAQSSECPEMRSRALRALNPYHFWRRELLSAGILMGFVQYDPVSLWRDKDLRLRICRQAVAGGCSPHMIWRTDKDWSGHWDGEPEQGMMCLGEIGRLRDVIRGKEPEPDPEYGPNW